MNVAEISRSSTIPVATLHRYLGLLKTLFLFDTIPAWANNLGKRFKKSPKLVIPDSGLLCFLLGIDSKKLLTDTELFGRILESFVISEIQKQLTWNKTRASCFHYRTESGAEVDLVLEDASGNIVGIEIKSTETVNAHHFKGLKDLQDSAGKKWVRGIVLYMGDAIVPFGKDMYALPISALWEL